MRVVCRIEIFFFFHDLHGTQSETKKGSLGIQCQCKSCRRGRQHKEGCVTVQSSALRLPDLKAMVAWLWLDTHQGVTFKVTRGC